MTFISQHSSSNKGWKNGTAALMLAIVLAHAALLFLVLPRVSTRLAPSYNQDQYADGYELLASNLAAGHGYRFYPETARTTMREPGYPVFLAALYVTLGTSFALVKLANLLLALATAGLMVRITATLELPRFCGHYFWLLVPPILFLFHPATLIAESRGGVEVLFSFLVTLFLLCVCRAVQSGSWKDYLVSGLVLGITVLVRSTPLLFPGFLLLYLLFLRRPRNTVRMVVRNLAVLTLATVAVLSPWIVRNYRLTGAFIPTSSVLGVSAQAGQYINEHLFEGRPFWLLDREASRERDLIAGRLGLRFEDGPQGYYQTFYRTQDEVQFSNYLLRQVRSAYRRSPQLLLRCIAQNTVNFWVGGKTLVATVANTCLQLPLLLLALAGIPLCLKSPAGHVAAVVMLFIVYLLAVHATVLAQARYSVPLIPTLCVFATAGLARLRHFLHHPANATFRPDGTAPAHSTSSANPADSAA